MGFDQPSSMHSSLFWIPQTPPTISRYDNNKKRSGLFLYNKKYNGASSLNRNFGSSVLPTAGRYPIGHICNAFNYSPTSPSHRSNCLAIMPSNKKHFDYLPKYKPSSSDNNYPFNSNSLSRASAPTYNTVHVRKPINDVIYDTTAEEYEDLDSYERSPLEDTKKKITNNLSPQYNTRSNTSATLKIENLPTIQTPKTPPTPPPIKPSLPKSNSFVFQSKPKNEKSNKNEKTNKKKQKSHTKTNKISYWKRKKICILIFIMLIFALLFAFIGAAFSYYVYNQNYKLAPITFKEFLNDPLRLFSQINNKDDFKIRKNSKTNNNNFYLISTKDQNNDKKILHTTEDYFNNQLSTTLDTEYDEDEFSRFNLNNLANGLPFIKKTNNLKSKENIENDIEKTSNTIKSFQSKGNGNEPLIEPKHLLTLQTTKQKICLFEIGTSETEQSRQDFRKAHIPGARLLFYASLNHNGVPVHPLKFQRYVRSLGIDSDCQVIVYDRNQQIWAAYAFWIFKLYGHTKIFLLNGGFEAWKNLTKSKTTRNISSTVENTYFQIETGSATFDDRPGNFRTGWNANLIATFDDLLANFNSAHKSNAEIIDAQTKEEFNGKVVNKIKNDGIIYGHIRGAHNIPCENLYDWNKNSWLPTQAQIEYFHNENVLNNLTRPIIIYDGTSLRSAMVWFALYKLNYVHLSIYFGSWPEWIIRAPDYLKVIPNND